MNNRPIVTTFATLAIFFLALVLGARLAVRQIAAPFNGIEHFARASRAPAPAAEPDYAETIRKIDWDAPVAPAAVAAKERGSTRTAPQVPSTRLGRIAAGEYLLEAAGIWTVEVVQADISLRLLASRQEPDLEALTSALKLTETQKASVSGLIEWRKSSIDMLTELKADDESKERVDESFREAVTSLLDAAQAKKYGDMNSGALQVPQTRGAATLSLAEVGTPTYSETIITSYLKAVAEKRKTE